MLDCALRRPLPGLLLACVVVGVADVSGGVHTAPRQDPSSSAPAAVSGVERARRLIDGTAADRNRAVDVLGEAIAAARAEGDREVQATAALLLGELLVTRLGREADVGLVHLQQAAALFLEAQRDGEAARATTLAGIALRRLGRIDDAEQAHRRALALYERVDDPLGRALVLHNLGATRYSQNALEEALALYRESVALRREHGDVALTASTLNNSATIHSLRGRPDLALDTHREALDVALAYDNRVGEGYALLGMGAQSYQLGEVQSAIGYLKGAATVFQTLGDNSGLGYARHTLGVAYLALGHDTDAVTVLENVVPLRQDDPARLGTTLQSLGGAYRMRGELDRAREAIEQALALKRQAGDRYGEAATLRSLAGVELDAGRPEQARAHAQRALELSRDVDRQSGVALSVVLLSRVSDSRPDQRLRAELDTALELALAVGDPQLEAAIRAEHARVLLLANALSDARAQVDAAVAAVERVRSAVASLDLRATYMARQADLLDLQVEILLASHRRAPSEGFDRAAFEAADRLRGRRLLDALGDAMVPDARNSPVRGRELVLERDVNVAARALERTTASPGADTTTLQADLDARLLALREFRADARTQLPWRREGAAPDLAALQRDLPADTTLLAYWMGSVHAVAWVVTPARVALVDLPPADRIRRAVRTTYTALADDEADTTARLQQLAQLVLHPVEPFLTTSRLAVVLDATLEFAPLAALPLTDGDMPLVTRYDLMRLPTATWLPDLARQERRSTAGTGTRIAVVADPVFSVADRRLSTGPILTASIGPRSDTISGVDAGVAPARLAFSRLEADAIAAVAPAATVLRDFDATKSALQMLALDGIDVLHFATHAEQHALRPELSSVILSLVDADGRPQDGRMRLHEVVGLPLTGQLVVLSACQTVIGPGLRGDGLQGLARGFLQAGASMVVASLWDVDDRATMVLMRHFYQALVGEGRSPSGALAHAQRLMQSNERWQHPRYWAGFVAVGVGE
jgi:CHAT domain-containing protein/tetratricopeptide (TPR) repeat protein